MTVLHTERLTLRPAREADLDPLHAIFTDPRAMEFWSTTAHESREQTGEWLASMMAIPPGEGEDFIVEHDGRLIGKAGLYRFPTIGYIFHPGAWGHGFAREALAPVIGRAFTAHGLERIDADVDPNNAGSLKLLEHLGFQRTGYREKSWLIGGKWFDSVDLELTAEKWRAGA